MRPILALPSDSRLRPTRALLALGAVLLASCQDTLTGPDSARGSLAPVAIRGASRAERPFTFTTIEHPAINGVPVRSTNASGINAGGDIVGGYVDPAGRGHGYLLRNGEFTTIDYPGSSFTDARGISPDGDIVGTYRLTGEPATRIHGYLLTKHGEFVPLNSPGHINTIAQRILGNGTVLGCRHDNDTMASMVGITFGRDGYSEINEFGSMHNGATPDGRHIVGLYTNMTTGRGEGYRIDDGVLTSLVFPNSIFTAAWDINPAGEIVGVYSDVPQRFHGFVLTEGVYVSIDVPAATATRAVGINARGDIVGNYTLGGRTYGYIATR